MDLGLKGKVALVTGGTRGLGRAMAEALLEESVHVVICARDAQKVMAVGFELTGVAGKHAATARGITADVSKAADCEGWLPKLRAASAASTSWSTTPARLGPVRSRNCRSRRGRSNST